MRSVKFDYRRRRSLALRLRLMAAPVLLIAAVLLADAHIRPMIQSMTSYQARVFATRAINASIAEQLSREDVSYDSLVRVSVGQDGKVSAVETDMVRLNRLKAELTDAASDRVALLTNQSISIPLGTLIGGQVFSGRGPKVEFRIVPAGYVESELLHRFDAAGINQTRHQIVLQLDAGILAVLPGYTTTTEVSTNVILAETVIVGVSPQSFTEVITGERQDVAGLIADYGK